MGKNLITPYEALEKILGASSFVGFEIVDIYSSPGRVIFEDPISRRSLPAFANSAMDGYAVKFEDIKNIPANLKVIGTIQAGDNISGLKLKKKTAYKIMTGAFIPEGADTVVEYEVTKENDGNVTILKEKKKGANIRFQGEDVKEGEVLALKGEVITPEIYARLISVGVGFVKVSRKPKVLIIATGNELAYPGENDDKCKTIDSNSFYLSEVLKKEGADVEYMGISRDNIDDFSSKLQNIDKYEFIVSSAGISEGDFDVVSNARDILDIQWIFKGVKQKPGKPFSFGFIRNKPLFALPGNPVSSAFCTYFYILPFLRKSIGRNKFYNDNITARTLDKMFKKNNRFHFNRGLLKYNGELKTFEVSPFVTQDSHIINSIVVSNCYIVIDGDVTGEIKEGSEVKCYVYNKDTIF
ncbi:MAG: molybdopterin molybdotransferase [Deferribacteres bacterium]|nr:molybdopterin molybdotransferase [Deferribacteres bacterium]